MLTQTKDCTTPPPYGTTIPASDPHMRAQFAEAMKYHDAIARAAEAGRLDPLIICGLGSRESGWGLLLHPPGPGGCGDFKPRSFPTRFRQGALPPEGGFGRGLMQIDFDAFEFARTGPWRDPAENIAFACRLLASNLALVARKAPFTGSDALRAALAAYNCGCGNLLRALRQARDPDFYTTGRNYSAEVLNRAGFFHLAGWPTKQGEPRPNRAAICARQTWGPPRRLRSAANLNSLGLERRAHMYVSTLQSFVKAMGGRLRFEAVFPEGTVEINQFRKIKKRT